jgi:tRNA dimethylallyltransferase
LSIEPIHNMVENSTTPATAPASLLLAGATAVGKSEVALNLALRLRGEIISVDSMQVYRGLDIGTAKPSSAQRSQVPHHLIDVAGLRESFDAASFAHRAKQAIAEIRGRGRVPILCGGTGLYFRALLEGLGAAPPADSALREVLESMPLPELLTELAERDPAAYARIDRQNPRRVIRAVEVIRLTGRPFSSQRAPWDASGGGAAPECAFGLSRAPGELRQRIEERVDEMFRRGLVQETEGLLKQGLAENRTAMQALGYRQVAEYLAGERSLAATIELVKIRTRQFAKRQMTWFRRQLKLNWIPIQRGQSAQEVADVLSELWRRFSASTMS